jgi:hypothetical protein
MAVEIDLTLLMGIITFKRQKKDSLTHGPGRVLVGEFGRNGLINIDTAFLKIEFISPAWAVVFGFDRVQFEKSVVQFWKKDH